MVLWSDAGQSGKKISVIRDFLGKKEVEGAAAKKTGSLGYHYAFGYKRSFFISDAAESRVRGR